MFIYWRVPEANFCWPHSHLTKWPQDPRGLSHFHLPLAGGPCPGGALMKILRKGLNQGGKTSPRNGGFLEVRGAPGAPANHPKLDHFSIETQWFWGFQISFVRIGHSINRALHQPGSKIRSYSKKSENVNIYIKNHYYSL